MTAEATERCDIPVSGMTRAVCSARRARSSGRPASSRPNANPTTGIGAAGVATGGGATSAGQLVTTIRDTGYGAELPGADRPAEDRIAGRDAENERERRDLGRSSS